MEVTIVIPVYNEEERLDACLRAISQQSHPPAEVIVVDNNSTDKSREIAERYDFVTSLPEKRQGIVFARNRGFDAASNEILARIDADTLLPPNWVESIKKLFTDNQHAKVAGVTGSPRFYDVAFAGFFNFWQVVAYQRFQKILTGTYVLWGANMAIRREAWRTARGDCSLRTDIDEDIDLSFCMHKKGLKIVFSPQLTVAASFQRGRTGFMYTVRYMSSWPKDFWLHSMYLRGALMAFVIVIGLILYAPMSAVLSLGSNQTD